MRPKLRVLATVLAGSLVALTAFSAGPANAAGTVVDTRTLPVTGAVDDAGGTFAGTFALTKFAAENDQLMAIGKLDGTLTDATGNTVATVSNIPATFPVTAAQATCTVLDLNLGGVDLNVLGLLVHLDPVHLNISADEGSLIGTLLCLIAGVLGGVAPSTAAVDPLNQLLPLL
jgi:hypothetical protein